LTETRLAIIPGGGGTQVIKITDVSKRKKKYRNYKPKNVLLTSNES